MRQGALHRASQARAGSGTHRPGTGRHHRSRSLTERQAQRDNGARLLPKLSFFAHYSRPCAKLARFVTLLANGGVVDGRRSRAARAEGPAGVDSRCDELLAIRDRFAAARRALDAWHTSAANARSYRDPPHS